MIVFVKYNVKKMIEYFMRDKLGQILSNIGEIVFVLFQGFMQSDVIIIVLFIYLLIFFCFVLNLKQMYFNMELFDEMIFFMLVIFSMKYNENKIMFYNYIYMYFEMG